MGTKMRISFQGTAVVEVIDGAPEPPPELDQKPWDDGTMWLDGCGWVDHPPSAASNRGAKSDKQH